MPKAHKTPKSSHPQKQHNTAIKFLLFLAPQKISPKFPVARNRIGNWKLKLATFAHWQHYPTPKPLPHPKIKLSENNTMPHQNFPFSGRGPISTTACPSLNGSLSPVPSGYDGVPFPPDRLNIRQGITQHLSALPAMGSKDRFS